MGEKRVSVTHVSERGRINDLLFTNHPLLLFPIQCNPGEYFIRGRNKWWISWMFFKRSCASLAVRLSPRVRRWSTDGSVEDGSWDKFLPTILLPDPRKQRLEKVGKSCALECIYIDPSVEDNLKGQGFRFDLPIEGGREGGKKKMGEEKEKSYISRGITNASAGGTWRGTFRRYSFHGEGVEVLLN